MTQQARLTVQPPARAHEAALLTSNGFCIAKNLVWLQAQGCQPGPHLCADLLAELLKSSPLLRAGIHPGGSLGPVSCRLCGPQILRASCIRKRQADGRQACGGKAAGNTRKQINAVPGFQSTGTARGHRVWQLTTSSQAPSTKERQLV